jgi:anti-sigma regulatory factor (Ser/Thr protein kinase)
MFRHEALLYRGPSDFLAGSLPHIRAGLAAEEPVLVAVDTGKIRSLRGALGADANRVEFADMAVVGRNPARIIPAWREFADAHPGPIRGIGEPIWSSRGESELIECQLHEALLNVAFADRAGFQLLCPYDTGALAGNVIHEACCSHPHVGGAPSRAYRDDLLAPFDSPLPPPPATARILGFELDTVAEVRRLVEHSARRAGLSTERAQDLVLAAGELAANSIRHGGGRGILRVWTTEDALVCEIRDRGRIADPLAGRVRPEPEQLHGRGLWIANSVCDLVQVRAGAVRAHMRF